MTVCMYAPLHDVHLSLLVGQVWGKVAVTRLQMIIFTVTKKGRISGMLLVHDGLLQAVLKASKLI